MDDLSAAVSASLASAWPEAEATSRANMKNWLLRALPRGAKRVHDWLKYERGEPPEVAKLVIITWAIGLPIGPTFGARL
eukprot:8953713-Pyramimonas_sp.AAC.1